MLKHTDSIELNTVYKILIFPLIPWTMLNMSEIQLKENKKTVNLKYCYDEEHRLMFNSHLQNAKFLKLSHIQSKIKNIWTQKIWLLSSARLIIKTLTVTVMYSQIDWRIFSFHPKRLLIHLVHLIKNNKNLN